MKLRIIGVIFCYQHDNREAPSFDSRRQAPQRRFSETRPPSDRTPWRVRGEEQGRREPRHRSYSGDDRNSSNWRGDREFRRRGERRAGYDSRFVIVFFECVERCLVYYWGLV